MKIIFQTEDLKFRITEVNDVFFNIDDLKGDSFKIEFNPDVSPEVLRRDEQLFERKVYDDGVYGYSLERWNPEPGKGYEHVDSCWGFVGKYSTEEPDQEHYIVEELKKRIQTL